MDDADDEAQLVEADKLVPLNAVDISMVKFRTRNVAGRPETPERRPGIGNMSLRYSDSDLLPPLDRSVQLNRMLDELIQDIDIASVSANMKAQSWGRRHSCEWTHLRRRKSTSQERDRLRMLALTNSSRKTLTPNSPNDSLPDHIRPTYSSLPSVRMSPRPSSSPGLESQISGRPLANEMTYDADKCVMTKSMSSLDTGRHSKRYVEHRHRLKSDNMFKIVIIGPSGVGKSSLIRRLVDNKFSSQYRQTIGLDFQQRLVTHLDVMGGKNLHNSPDQAAVEEVANLNQMRRVRLQLWDIAGNDDRASNLKTAFYRGAVGAILVFDYADYIRSRTTWPSPEITHWLAEAQRQIVSPTKPIPVMVVANKCDLVDHAELQDCDIETPIHQFVAELQCIPYWFKTSAKSGQGVSSAVRSLIKYILSVNGAHNGDSGLKLDEPSKVSDSPTSRLEPKRLMADFLASSVSLRLKKDVNKNWDHKIHEETPVPSSSMALPSGLPTRPVRRRRRRPESDVPSDMIAPPSTVRLDRDEVAKSISSSCYKCVC